MNQSKPKANRTVVLVDDHPLLGMGLKAGLDDRGIHLCVLDPRVDSLIDRIAACRPSVVLVDLSMPIEGGGLGVIRSVADLGVSVAVLTGETDRSKWADAVSEGAEVVLAKGEPLDEIFDAVLRLSMGAKIRLHQRSELEAVRRESVEQDQRMSQFDQLTPREEAVLQALVEGVKLKNLAELGNVSVHTVRTQAKSVLRKLGVHSQLEAVALARDLGWTPRVASS